MISSVSVQGSCLVAASDLAMNGSSGRPGWVLARRRCCHFCCHALAGRRWGYEHCAARLWHLGGLCSPRWPREAGPLPHARAAESPLSRSISISPRPVYK